MKHPARLEKLEVHLGLSFSRWGNHRLEGPAGVMLWQPWGRAGVVRVQPLLLPFSASLLQEGALASALGSGICFSGVLSMDSCLLVGLLVRGAEVGSDLCCPLDDVSL